MLFNLTAECGGETCVVNITGFEENAEGKLIEVQVSVGTVFSKTSIFLPSTVKVPFFAIIIETSSEVWEVSVKF